MIKPKEAAEDVLREVPEDASFEDIIYRIYVRSKIEKALSEPDDDLVDQEEVEKMMAKWVVE